MPHRAVEELRQDGLQMTLIEDQTRTGVLKGSVTKMYADFEAGLLDIGLPRD